MMWWKIPGGMIPVPGTSYPYARNARYKRSWFQNLMSSDDPITAMMQLQTFKSRVSSHVYFNYTLKHGLMTSLHQKQSVI